MDSTAGTSAVTDSGDNTQQVNKTHVAMKALGKALQIQDGGLRLLLERVAVLESTMDKLRSEPVKEAIRDVLTVTAAFKDSREKVTRAYNAVVDYVKADINSGKMSVGETAPKTAVKEAETQSPCWWDIVVPPVTRQATALGKAGLSADLAPTSWTEVVKKNRKAKPSQKEEKEKITTKANPRVRVRPQAIMVDVNSTDFPALATKIRGGVDHNVIGDSITGMRQAKSGGLLIEVRGDQERIEAVRAEIARSAGPDVQVKSLQQRTLVEILDLDQWTSVDEVSQAVASAVSTGQDTIKVFNLRKRFGGSQMALVSLPLEASRKLINAGRLRIGMVSCKVRMAEAKVRCFRCLAFGHTSFKCEGPDRTACCRRCGGSGGLR